MSTTETAAGLLRRAAKTIRDRLEPLPPSPWRAEGRDVTATQDYEEDGSWDWERGYVVAACPRQDEAEHVAAWCPPAALAAAALLEETAGAVEGIPSLSRGHVDGLPCDDYACRIKHAALKVAEAFLNETPDTPSPVAPE